MNTLMDGLDDSVAYCNIKTSNYRRITSTNFLERLNREIRRRTRVVGIFPNIESYIRLVTIYLIENMEDWSDYKYLSLTKK